MHVRSLLDYLHDEVPVAAGVKVEPRKVNPQSQDFGTTLLLILGTAAAKAIADGIKAWLQGHTGAAINIVTEQGQVVIKNVESKSAAEIVKALSTSKSQHA